MWTMESFYLIEYFVIVSTMMAVHRMRRFTLIHMQFRDIDVNTDKTAHSAPRNFHNQNPKNEYDHEM